MIPDLNFRPPSFHSTSRFWIVLQHTMLKYHFLSKMYIFYIQPTLICRNQVTLISDFLIVFHGLHQKWRFLRQNINLWHSVYSILKKGFSVAEAMCMNAHRELRKNIKCSAAAWALRILSLFSFKSRLNISLGTSTQTLNCEVRESCSSASIFHQKK